MDDLALEIAWINIITGTICLIKYISAVVRWRVLPNWKRTAVLVVILLTLCGVGGYGWIALINPFIEESVLWPLFSGWCVLAIFVYDTLATVQQTTIASGVYAELAAAKAEMDRRGDELARVNQYWEMSQFNNGQLKKTIDRLEAQLGQGVDESQ